MAGHMDERGYADNGRRRDYDDESRMMRRNRRREEHDGERNIERDGGREFEREEMPQRFRREFREPLRVGASLSDAFVSAFERGAQVWGENLRLYQDETVRFVTERLEHDTKMFEQLGRSRSMFDLLSIQQKWLSQATRAYSEELMRLSRITNGVAQRSSEETRAAMSDVRRSGYDAE